MVTDEELRNISILADKQIQAEQELGRLEQAIKDKKQELNNIRDRDLPNAMAECGEGLESFKLTSGFKISIHQEVYASISEEKSAAAFAWLREHKFGAIIKNIIYAEFGRGEDEAAIKAATVLAEAGFKPNQKESVHPQTLKAFIREQLKKNSQTETPLELPLDLLGAYVVNRAKVEK